MPVAPKGSKQIAYLIHDIQSVVASVSLMVEQLELDARAGDDPTQRARAISARNSCRQMASLCAEVTRLLGGVVDEAPVPEEFDLLALLVEVLSVYSPIYDLSGKTLKLVTKSRSPKFFGIRSQLFRAISNLLDNGLKHTSDGSVVIVDCVDTREEVLVAVCDDGPGIADIVAGEPISIDPSLAGTGQFPVLAAALRGGSGLMFVSEVMAMNGGSTTVERNLNGGTSVTMKFPKH